MTIFGRFSTPSTNGQFGYCHTETAYHQTDPKERVVAIVFAYRFPFNWNKYFAAVQMRYYQTSK